MHHAIYEKLKHVAKNQEKTTYKAIASMAKFNLGIPEHWEEIARILAEISTQEHNHGRPLLSAVVVLQETNIEKTRPGNNFFTLAQNLGLYSGHGEFADRAFFSKELRKVHAAWKEPAANQSGMDTF